VNDIKRENLPLRPSSPPKGFFQESNLRDFIAANLDAIEPGLRLYDSEGRATEFPCKLAGRRRSGSIDILAVDAEGAFVVIECKLGPATPSALGQILGYIAWVNRHMRALGPPVRGIIVASEVTPFLALAVRFLKGVSITVFECPNPSTLCRVF